LYDSGVRASWLIAMVAGCTGGTTPAPARPARAPEPTPWAVAEPAPRKPEPPPAAEIGLDRELAWISDELSRAKTKRDVVVIERRFQRLGGPSELDVADRDFWDACVREVVLQQPAPLQRPLAALVNTYATSCDGEGRVVLDRPLDLDGRERTGAGVAIVGRFGAGQIDLALRVEYCGDDQVDHVTVLGQDARWDSQRLEFQRDGACVRADIPLTRTVARAAHALADGQGSLRVEGPRGYDVIAADEGAQRLLRIALDVRDTRDALDAAR
jgi:hypothetical protein